MKLIESNIDKIIELCRLHKVSKLFAFGSVLSKNFKQSSDIDLLVDFEDMDVIDYADNYFNLKSALEAILKRPIDLLEQQAVKNPYLKKSIDTNKQLIYG